VFVEVFCVKTVGATSSEDFLDLLDNLKQSALDFPSSLRLTERRHVLLL